MISECLDDVVTLFINTAVSKKVVYFPQVFQLCDHMKDYCERKEEGSYSTEVFYTITQASREVCSQNIAIYSSLLAKGRTGIPSTGFFSNGFLKSRDFYQQLKGNLNEQSLVKPEHHSIALEITNRERARVYAHAAENFE